MELRKKDSINQAQSYSAQAIGMLEEWELPCDPINYAVAYEIAKGKHVELMHAYRKHIDNGRKVDAYTLEHWQVDFLQVKASDQSHLLSGLDDILGNVQKQVSTSGGSVEDFLNQLNLSIKALNQSDSASSTNKVLDSLLSATRLIKGHHSRLQNQLAVSQSETQALRDELEKAKTSATTDVLTGLLNRRGLDNYLQELNQHHGELVAIVLDIDHFKRFNDTFGHLIGDIVIAKVAEQLKKAKPEYARAIRYGGEEFILLLPNNQLDSAHIIAEDIRKRVESMKLVNGKTRERLPQITISLGIAKQNDGEEFNALIGRADQALYTAKDKGRNQVQLANETITSNSD